MDRIRSPQANFTLSREQLSRWQCQREPSGSAVLDCFESGPPNPLAEAGFYPGLERVAKRTSIQKLVPSHLGDPLERGICLAGPLLGSPGAALLMLVKEGAFEAKWIEHGQVQSLVVNQENSPTTCQIQTPDGRQLGFYRGLDGRDEIALRSEQGGASLEAHFVDRPAEQPRLERVVAATREYGESDQGPHYIDQAVVLRPVDQNRSRVSMSRDFRAVNSDFAVRKQMNHLFSSADISMGDRVESLPFPKAEEWYLVADSVMKRLPD